MNQKKIGVIGIVLFLIMAVPTMSYASDTTEQDTTFNDITNGEIMVTQSAPLDQIDQKQPQFNYSAPIGNINNKRAQSFIPSLSTLTRFKLQFQKSSGPAEFSIYWINIYSGIPGGNSSIIYSAFFNSNIISTGIQWYEFDIPDQTVTNGSTYYIELYGDLPTNYTTSIQWCYGVNTLYTNGDAYVYSSPTWNLFTYLGNPCDYCFMTYGLAGGPNSPPSTPTDPTGPSEGDTGEPLLFTTSSIDPDGDMIKYHVDVNNDGLYEHTSPFYPSGATYNLFITFNTPGTYYVRFKAEDVYGAMSNWSNAKTVTISSGSNNPPNTPNPPSGPSNGMVGTVYTFSTASTDPDDDQIKYGFDWDGDDIVDDWSGLFDSGDVCMLSYSWSMPGTYQIKVKAQDEYGLESGWSSIHPITITSANTAPNKPNQPSGPTSGRTDVSYTYSTVATDPEGDQLYYKWDWGNEVSPWDGPYNSGDTVMASHTWDNKGSFVVKVKVKDTGDLESVWSDPLTVSMPKTKQYQNDLLQQFFDNHPFLYNLIKQVFWLQ